LGGQTLDPPSATIPWHIPQPVVQPVRPSLPEFDRSRDDAIASPGCGPRHRPPLVLDCQFLRPLLQHLPAVYDLALWRSAGAELAAAWTAGEIGIGLFRRCPFDAPLDPD